MCIRFASLWDFTPRGIVGSYRRLGGTYRSSWTAWLLNMGQIGRPETSVRGYRSTLHRVPKELRS